MLTLLLFLLSGTAPATITTQPVSQTVTAPATATFCVTANGSKIVYAWYVNSVVISGAAAKCYTTPATTVAQSGEAFYVTLSNRGGTVKSNLVTLTVTPASTGTAPAITSAATATGTVGTAFTFTVTATGSPAPAITEAGALPAGITWSAPTLSGTPTTAGITDLAFTAANSAGSAGQSFIMTVNAPPPTNTLTYTQPVMPAGVVGSSYSANLLTLANVKLNGVPCSTCSFALTGGSLGSLNLSSAGLIAGTPTTAGTLSFTVTVTAGTAQVKMTIGEKHATILPAPDSGIAIH